MAELIILDGAELERFRTYMQRAEQAEPWQIQLWQDGATGVKIKVNGGSWTAAMGRVEVRN